MGKSATYLIQFLAQNQNGTLAVSDQLFKVLVSQFFTGSAFSCTLSAPLCLCQIRLTTIKQKKRSKQDRGKDRWRVSNNRHAEFDMPGKIRGQEAVKGRLIGGRLLCAQQDEVASITHQHTTEMPVAVSNRSTREKMAGSSKTNLHRIYISF